MCNEPPQCPQDGPECCQNDPCNAPNPPETCPCGGPYTGKCVTDVCMSPNPPEHCPCDGPYTSKCPPKPDCDKNLCLQLNGAEGDGAELEESAVLGLEGKFRQKKFQEVTVEMWLKDNTMPMHRTVYFGGGEFKDEGFEAEQSCILSGFALGQWNGQLTFDVATEDGIAGVGCGVHLRSPDWALGTHKGQWVHVAATYNGVTGETSLYIDGELVRSDFEGQGAIVWPAAGSAQFVMGRNGDFLHSMGGDTGMDGELDEVRVWTAARSRADLVEYMHKTMPENGAFGPYPMDTVALYLRFECQEAQASEFHRVCSAAEWPMALQLGSYPTTQIVESGAPLEMLVTPVASCPAAPDDPGPHSWSTWAWASSGGGKATPAEEVPTESEPVAVLGASESLFSDGAMNELDSSNGLYAATMQGDGNFVLYDQGGAPLWNTGTSGQGTGPFRLDMQSDGNLVLYDKNGQYTWASNTAGSGGLTLVMQDDGNLVIYSPSGQAVWDSGTSQLRPTSPISSLKASTGDHRLATALTRMSSQGSKTMRVSSREKRERAESAARLVASQAWDATKQKAQSDEESS